MKYITKAKRLGRVLTVWALAGITTVGYSGFGPGAFAPQETCLFPCEMPYPLTFTGRFGDSYLEGQVDLMLPLGGVSDGGLAPFSLLSYNRNDYGAQTLSLGLGARWLNYDLNSVLGFRVHGDFHETAAGNNYNQLGFGFDLFHGSGFDLTANYYLPLTDSRVTNSYRMSSSSSTTRNYERQNGTSTTYHDARAVDNEIRQYCDHFSNIESVREVTTTDISRFFQEFERGREGGDIRLTFDIFKKCNETFIPLGKGGKQFAAIGDDCHLPKLRGTVGGYYYDSHFGSAFKGFMAGLHAHLAPGLTIGVEYYEDKELYGEHWLGTVGVSVPVRNIFNPGEFCANLFSKPNHCSYDDYLASRLYATGPRMVRPLLEQSGPVEDLNQRIITTSVQETVTGTRQEFIRRDDALLKNNVVFVNNGGAVGNGIGAGGGVGENGLAANPFDTIQEATEWIGNNNPSGWMVYVQNSGAAYNETVFAGSSIPTILGVPAPLPPSNIQDIGFISSAKPIIGKGGRNFGGNTPNVLVNGGFHLRNEPMAAPAGTTHLQSVMISGFSVNGISGALPVGNPAPPGGVAGNGILVGNVDNFTADCVKVLSAEGNGIVYNNWNGAAGSVSITNSMVSNTGTGGGSGHGIVVEAENAGTVLDVFIANNMISNTGAGGDGINVATLAATTVNPTINSTGVINNAITNTSGDGIEFNVGGGSILVNGYTGNTFTGIGTGINTNTPNPGVTINP